MRAAADVRAALEARQRRAEPGLIEETGTIEVEGLRLFFHLWRPDGEARRVGVSIAHSFVDHAILQAAEAAFGRAAARAGIAVILVQAPGAGDSEGAPEACTMADRIRAVAAGWAELRRRVPETERPCFLGAALGGLVAAHAAAGNDQACLALWQPSLHGDAYWADVRRMLQLAMVRERRGEPRAADGDGPAPDPDAVLDREGLADVLGMRVTAAQLQELRDAGRGLDDGTVAGPALLVTAADRDERAAVRRIVRGPVEVAVGPGRRTAWHLGRPGGLDVAGPTVDWLLRVG
ncbi:MAG TPA: hypothetical protein VEO00_08300 [Actinomycetota bacterium]|nr:hypothetical protein [Actinomycetota bacterium]